MPKGYVRDTGGVNHEMIDPFLSQRYRLCTPRPPGTYQAASLAVTSD